MSETELLRMITKGDEAAFAALFNNYRNKIYSIAYELTESTTIAEEIVQDTFLKIWLRRETLEDINHFKAYLYTIARRKNMELKIVQQAPSFYSDTENRVIQKEYDEILKKAVNSLPPKQKQVYLLMKEKGLKRHEVAAELQLNEPIKGYHLGI
jgi:RNA polymerase sigma-70 factor (ECF subfamily)